MAEAFLSSLKVFGPVVIRAANDVREPGGDRPQRPAVQALFDGASREEVGARIPFSLLRTKGDGAGGGHQYFFTREPGGKTVVKDGASWQLSLWSGMGSGDFVKRKPEWLVENIESAIEGVLSMGGGKAGPAAELRVLGSAASFTPAGVGATLSQVEVAVAAAMAPQSMGVEEAVTAAGLEWAPVAYAPPRQALVAVLAGLPTGAAAAEALVPLAWLCGAAELIRSAKLAMLGLHAARAEAPYDAVVTAGKLAALVCAWTECSELAAPLATALAAAAGAGGAAFGAAVPVAGGGVSAAAAVACAAVAALADALHPVLDAISEGELKAAAARRDALVAGGFMVDAAGLGNILAGLAADRAVEVAVAAAAAAAAAAVAGEAAKRLGDPLAGAPGSKRPAGVGGSAAAAAAGALPPPPSAAAAAARAAAAAAGDGGGGALPSLPPRASLPGFGPILPRGQEAADAATALANLGGSEGAGHLRALRGCSALAGGFGQPTALAETAADDFEALLAEARRSGLWDERRDGAVVPPASWAAAAKVIVNVATRVELDRKGASGPAPEDAVPGARGLGPGAAHRDSLDASGLPAGSWGKLSKAAAGQVPGAVSADVAAGALSRGAVLASHNLEPALGATTSVVAEAQRLAAMPGAVGESARRMLASNGTVSVTVGAIAFDGKAPEALVRAVGRMCTDAHTDILEIVGGEAARRAAVADDAQLLAIEVITGRLALKRVVRVLGGVKPHRRKHRVAQTDAIVRAAVGTFGKMEGAAAAHDIERAMGHLGALLRRYHCEALALGSPTTQITEEVGLKALAASVAASGLTLEKSVEIFNQLFEDVAEAFGNWRTMLRAPAPDWPTLVDSAVGMLDEQLEVQRAEEAGERGADRRLQRCGVAFAEDGEDLEGVGELKESARTRKRRLAAERKAAQAAAKVAPGGGPAPKPGVTPKGDKDKQARETQRRNDAAAAAFVAAAGAGGVTGGGALVPYAGGGAPDDGGEPESFTFRPGSLTQKFGKKGTPGEFVGCVNAFDSLVRVPGGNPAKEPCAWRALFPPCVVPGSGKTCRHCVQGGTPAEASADNLAKVVAAMSREMQAAHAEALSRV